MVADEIVLMADLKLHWQQDAAGTFSHDNVYIHVIVMSLLLRFLLLLQPSFSLMNWKNTDSL